MSYSLRENLEIVHLNDTDSIHRSQCGFRYCRADQNWREFCKMPIATGERGQPHVHFERPVFDEATLLPLSCAALLEIDFIEKQQDATEKT